MHLILPAQFSSLVVNNLLLYQLVLAVLYFKINNNYEQVQLEMF